VKRRRIASGSAVRSAIAVARRTISSYCCSIRAYMTNVASPKPDSTIVKLSHVGLGSAVRSAASQHIVSTF
jgi:hypothetical protein